LGGPSIAATDCAVFGVPDESYGEEVVVILELRDVGATPMHSASTCPHTMRTSSARVRSGS
jgi:acyl-CoA synthetase (AMP-forming)/AMP-acid ligase II